MLVLNGVCSWQELNEYWSFEDIRRAAAMLEYKAETERRIEKIVKATKGN